MACEEHIKSTTAVTLNVHAPVNANVMAYTLVDDVAFIRISHTALPRSRLPHIMI